MGYETEDEVRNKRDEAGGDSLMEKKKMDAGVDIEPEADEWVAKPASLVDSDDLIE